VFISVSSISEHELSRNDFAEGGAGVQKDTFRGGEPFTDLFTLAVSVHVNHPLASDLFHRTRHVQVETNGGVLEAVDVTSRATLGIDESHLEKSREDILEPELLRAAVFVSGATPLVEYDTVGTSLRLVDQGEVVAKISDFSDLGLESGSGSRGREKKLVARTPALGGGADGRSRSRTLALSTLVLKATGTLALGGGRRGGAGATTRGDRASGERGTEGRGSDKSGDRGHCGVVGFGSRKSWRKNCEQTGEVDRLLCNSDKKYQ